MIYLFIYDPVAIAIQYLKAESLPTWTSTHSKSNKLERG